ADVARIHLVPPPKLRNKKDLSSIRIFHLRPRRISFYIDFPCVGRIRTRHATALSRNLRRCGTILGLRRRSGTGRWERLRGRRRFRSSLMGSRLAIRPLRLRRPTWGCSISVTLPLTGGLRYARRLTSQQRHTESN